jgi:hypothetical protein
VVGLLPQAHSTRTIRTRKRRICRRIL